jgi:hypothetical protein
MTSDDLKPFPPRRKRPDPPVIEGNAKPFGEPAANEPVEAKVEPIEARVVPEQLASAPETVGSTEPTGAAGRVPAAAEPVGELPHEPARQRPAEEGEAAKIAEPPASEATGMPAPIPQPAAQRSLASILASLAALAAMVVSGLVWFGQRVDGGKLSALETRAAALVQELDTLDKRVGATESTLQKSVAANADLSQGLAAVDGSVKAAVRAAEAARTDAAKMARGDSASVDLHPLEERIAQVEAAIKSPKMEGKAVADRIALPPPGEMPGNAAGLVVIGQSLVEAIAAGEPFQTQLNAAEILGADPAHTTVLKPFAAKGVATFATVAQNFLPLANRMARVDAVGSQAESLVDRAVDAIQRLVKVRNLGEPVGDDPAALAGQIEQALKRGDGGKASAVWDKLPAPAKNLSQVWFNDLKTVNDVQSAARAILSDAIAALGKPKS